MKYHTGVPIGRGGMGDVVRAWDPTLNRDVALKFVRSDDLELEERMVREARAQARVSHPNICPVYEVGRHDGRVFIAMQLVDGQPLHEVAEELGLEQKVRLIRTVAEAVHAAHVAGLVHRDLKPANILVESGEDGARKPWVVDFGIARERGVEGATVTGQVIGTPGYLSPEQARGEVSTIDRRTDVFSLGVVLYELLAGCRPYTGDSDVEALVGLLEGQAVPLRRRAPHVPRDLETVVMTCLEYDRERRYGSARELADDLTRFLAGEPVAARPAGVMRRFMTRARRRPVVSSLFVVAGVTIIVLIAGLVGAQYRARQEAEEAQRLGMEIKDVEGRMRQAGLLPLHDIRGERSELAARLVQLEHRVDVLGRASRGPALLVLGRGYLALDRYDTAREHLERARSEGYWNDETALALGHTLGLLYRRARAELVSLPTQDARDQRLQAAREQLRDPALSLLRSADRESGSLMSGLLEAEIALYEDDWERAAELAQRVYSAGPGRYEAAQLAAQAFIIGAEQAWRSGAADRALELLRMADKRLHQAIDIARSDPELYELLAARWAREMAFTSRAGGDPSPALEQLLGAVDRLLIADPDDAGAAIARANGWWVQAEHLRLHGQDPREALRETIRAAESVVDRGDVRVEALTFLGLAAWLHGEIEAHLGGDAMSWLHRAENAFTTIVELSPGYSAGHTNLGIVLAVRGRLVASSGGDPEPFWRRAVESYHRALDVDSEDNRAWNNLGNADTMMARHLQAQERDPSPWLDEAISSYQRSVALQPAVQPYTNLAIACSIKAYHLRATAGGDLEEVLTEGIEALRHAVSLDSRYANTHNILGNLLWLLAEHRFGRSRDPAPLLAEAAASFADAGRLSPRFNYAWAYAAGAWRTLAEYQLASGGDPIEALEHADQALTAAAAADPDSLDVCAEQVETTLLRARWSQGNGGDAEPYLDGAAATIEECGDGAESSSTVQMARANLARQRLEFMSEIRSESECDAGLKAASRALELDGLNNRVRAIRGVLRLHEEPPNIAAARADLETALGRNPALRPEYDRYLELVSGSEPVDGG